MENKLMTGNEAVVQGAIDAGAKIMFGYPITPATEILNGWINKCTSSNELQYLQTEDEIAAGFGVLGSVLGGVKAFTASAGPGHVLLQDALSMAENMRLPFVGIAMQRGGPSTGTVNFSQQEVNLAAFGGNGDGLRVVYSASTVGEMYDLIINAFSTAWKYRFPTILLGDGYLGKMKTTVALKKHLNPVAPKPLLEEKTTPTYLRNCYSSEDSFAEKLSKNIADWESMKSKIVLSENYKLTGSKYLIVAHGIVGAAAKEAVDLMRKQGIKIGVWRPITIHPIDREKLLLAARGATKIFVVESSLNQLARIIKYELSAIKANISEISKPAQGFTPEEIVRLVRSKI